MTERSSGLFSAGATGVPVTTRNIVLHESYKMMNQSASSSSPAAQNQDHNTTTNNLYNSVTATSFANTNLNTSILPRCDPDLNNSLSGGESQLRRSGGSDSDYYSSLFRTKLNLNEDLVRSGGERLSSNNSNDVCSVGSRDSGYILSQGSGMVAVDSGYFWPQDSEMVAGESGYFLPQDSGMFAEDDWDGLVSDYFPEPDSVSNILNPFNLYIRKPAANVTTSNSNPPQPPQIVIEKNHQGEVAREMTNSGLITDLSSCNNIGSVPPACDDEDEVLSPESSGVDSSSESLVIITEGNHEVKSHQEPKIGMKFSSEEDALKFYKKYAMEIGFKVRKGKVQRLADKSLAKRYFYCSNEGFRSKKQPNMKKFTRKETRTGCKAMIQMTFKNEECSISQFISEHNHDLQGSTFISEHNHDLQGSSQWYHVDSCSEIPKADSLIQHGVMGKEAEAGACARFCDMSYSKHLRAKKINILQPEDAQGLIDYFKKLQVKDPSLFYTFQVDAESRMTNFFWRDSRSKIDYDYFGDVLILDTTFQTDRYNMICAQFLGLNHHHQVVLFGCAFLLDASVESYTWLLGTFIEVMGKRQPKTIFTTECSAISEAVEATLPKSQHRLRVQFIYQNAKQYLSLYYGHPGFEGDFCRCLFDHQSEGEFQSSWSSLLEQYNLHENSWLQNIYTLRSKWSYLFSTMTFCAGINSNQGPEYFNNANVFQDAESEAMMLWEYVLKYEKAAEHRRREELHKDMCCSASESELFLRSPMEKQAASIYTSTMFEKFRRELIGSMSVPLKRMARKGTVVTYKTEGEKTQCILQFNSLDSTITCSCEMFESVGILCAHALKVLNIRNIFRIPPQYILKRWTKSAKDGVVEGDYNGEEIADNSESLCKSKFMHKALNFITKSVAVEKTRKIAERYLDIARKEVDDELKRGNEHHNTKDAEVNHEGVRNTSSVARVDWQEKVVKDLYLNQGETSKGTMEFQIQKKRKNEVREKMNLQSSSMSLP